MEKARRRLADHGYVAAFSGTPAQGPEEVSSDATTRRLLRLAPGTSFDLRVTVEWDGRLCRWR